MKTFKKSMMTILPIAVILIIATSWGCNKTEDLGQPGQSQSVLNDLKSSDNSLVFPLNANMYGKSYAQWAQSFFGWQTSFDCAHYPYYDATGALQNQGQSGQVFFLAGAPLGAVTNREVTVPADVSLFVPVIYYYENVCGGGSTDGITEDVTGFANLMDQLVVTIDGVAVNANNYKTITSLFNSTPNADLQNCIGDPCFDGSQNTLAIGGYWLMLKKLSPGTHTIHTVGGASAVFPVVKDVTWTIHQQ